MFGVSQNFKMHVLCVLSCKTTDANQDQLLAPMVDSYCFQILARRSQREIRRKASEQKRTGLAPETCNTQKSQKYTPFRYGKNDCDTSFLVHYDSFFAAKGSRMTNAIYPAVDHCPSLNLYLLGGTQSHSELLCVGKFRI